MATWHVRPDTSHSGTRNGTAYSTAWGGWSEIVWGAGGVVGGDTLVVHGTHTKADSALSVGNHGATVSSSPAFITGDSDYEPGRIILTNTFFYCSRSYTEISDLYVERGGTLGSVVYTEAVNHFAVRRCDVSGGNVGISFSGILAFNGVYIEDNVIHDIGGTYGSSGRGISHLTTAASLSHSRFYIRGNEIFNCADAAIRLSIESGGYTSSTYNVLAIERNNIHDNGGGIWARSGTADTTTPITVYSTGLSIRWNTVVRNGGAAGQSVATPGGVSIAGWLSPKCHNNQIEDVYVQGAGIQTAKNSGALIWGNTIRRVRSGSPISAYQGGFPIDGNGIFFDNLSTGGRAWGNYAEDLVSTGVTNSGTAFAFWDCNNCVFTENIAVNCYRGMSYGNDTEYGNAFYNNTVVDCDIGVSKVGTDVLTGSVMARNNLLVNCANGFLIAANPGIDEDYSLVYGSTTAYSGISQGTNSIAGVDPKLDNSYRPLDGSPCIRAGTAIANIWKSGKRPKVRPDIGAKRHISRRKTRAA